MPDNRAGSAIGGAASGAAAGFAVGGPVGAVVGGVAGAVIGGIAGGQADMAQRALRIAAKWERRDKTWQAAMARRDMLRQARVQQATALAFAASEEGGTISTGYQGARASSTSQLGFNLNYMANRDVAQQAITRQMARAGKYQASAATIGTTFQAVAGAVGQIGASMPKEMPPQFEDIQVTGQRIPEPWMPAGVQSSGATTYGIGEPSAQIFQLPSGPRY